MLFLKLSKSHRKGYTERLLNLLSKQKKPHNSKFPKITLTFSRQNRCQKTVSGAILAFMVAFRYRHAP